jgi:drug/metabolite transporter (DMT)-like permease
MKNKSVQANLVLLITAVIWGGGFVAQRLGMQQMGPYIFNGFRFFIGALTIVPIILIRKQTGATQKGDLKRTLLVGAVAGIILFFGATFQQLGLVYTTAGKAGFITGLYVVIVPLLGMLWGDRGSLFTWLGAMLAVIGLYILSASRGVVFAPGDGFVLIGACFWALHVQFIARYSPDVDVFQLSFVQSLFTSLISFGVGFFTEDVVIDQVLSAAIPILYGGVISIGIAYTLQVVGQRYAKPTSAAIILSLESVFAAFWGWLILDELLKSRALLGSGLMLAGMLISQMRRKTPEKNLDY